MTTCWSLLGQVHIIGWPPQAPKQGIPHSTESYKCCPKTHSWKLDSRVGWRTFCCSKLSVAAASPSNSIKLLDDVVNRVAKDANNIAETQGMIVGELDPATVKLAIGFLGPFLSAFAFLFILRIIMSWYPKLPVGKFPYVIAYAPTEPLLIPTRKLIPPLGGVDVTPVVWFGLVSFLNEILVGPQGLLVLLSQQLSS
ncbi:hypothetical protein FNV43_RR27064 [Rhamnella rubrinervis]|uniref:Protein COFACTOR ASSEMBLY OF COMPLEX C SUBUNIT B CCB3, chloroplastic n=1 Tax=Rhamnella rubrinervis TaxID=2594499 RepID=A0A8K0GN49_9ROSA|nr:hypothetical protein FNV43_RR27064 [Rhamnella rubrinervis]